MANRIRTAPVKENDSHGRNKKRPYQKRHSPTSRKRSGIDGVIFLIKVAISYPFGKFSERIRLTAT